MITTSDPKRPRVFRIAVALSVVAHLLGLLIYIGLVQRFINVPTRQQKTEELVALSDTVRIEKRTIPREAIKRPTPPTPVTKAQPQPAAPPVVVQHPVRQPLPKPRAAPTAAVRRELAKIVPNAEPQPRDASTPAPPAPEQPKAAPQAQPRTRQSNALTSEQIAAMDQQFRRTIAQSKSDIENMPPPKQVASSMKRYENLMQGATFRDLQHAQGIIDWVYRNGREGERNWYYVRVRISYPDGFTEIVDVPWRFYFPRRADPIAMMDPRPFIPPPPPENYALPKPFALSRFVCTYFHNECQAVLDGEERNGGQPATSTAN